MGSGVQEYGTFQRGWGTEPSEELSLRDPVSAGQEQCQGPRRMSSKEWGSAPSTERYHWWECQLQRPDSQRLWRKEEVVWDLVLGKKPWE